MYIKIWIEYLCENYENKMDQALNYNIMSWILSIYNGTSVKLILPKYHKSISHEYVSELFQWILYHVHEWDVEEHSAGDGKDPGVGGGVGTHNDPQDQPQVTHTGRQEVIQQRLLHSHPRIQQDCKVTCINQPKDNQYTCWIWLK